jgi:ABC-type transporter Mla subunit MlaD
MAPEIAAEIGRISAALVAALSEAKAMTDAGKFDAELAELVRHAREMSELLNEALDEHGAEVGEYARSVAAHLSDAIARLEQTLHQPDATH